MTDFPQRLDEPPVVLGEADGGAEPCAVFEPVIIGTVAHGDPEAFQEDAVQIAGRGDPAEQHVVGGGGERLHAGQVGQLGNEMGAAFGVFRAGAVREVRGVVEGGDGGGQREGVDGPRGQFGAHGGGQRVRSREVAEAHPRHGVELGQRTQRDAVLGHPAQDGNLGFRPGVFDERFVNDPDEIGTRGHEAQTGVRGAEQARGVAGVGEEHRRTGGRAGQRGEKRIGPVGGGYGGKGGFGGESGGRDAGRAGGDGFGRFGWRVRRRPGRRSAFFGRRGRRIGSRIVAKVFRFSVTRFLSFGKGVRDGLGGGDWEAVRSGQS